MPEINSLFLCGKVTSIEKSHEHLGDQFYKFMIEVPRLSDNVDVLPMMVSQKLLHNNEIAIEDTVVVSGQVRTHNQKEDGRNKLLVFGYLTEIKKISVEEMQSITDKNIVKIEGYVCKNPIFRSTSTGRKITDLLIAVNRQHNKSDYIPSISWGINATFAKNLSVGEKINLTGRFQSRNYSIKIDEDNLEERVALEISIAQLGIAEED